MSTSSAHEAETEKARGSMPNRTAFFDETNTTEELTDYVGHEVANSKTTYGQLTVWCMVSTYQIVLVLLSFTFKTIPVFWFCIKVLIFDIIPALVSFVLTRPRVLLKLLWYSPSLLKVVAIEIWQHARPRFADICREFPKTLRGMMNFWPDISKEMAVVAWCNFAIFVFDIGLAKLNAYVNKQIHHPEGWSYFAFLVLAVANFLFLRWLFEITLHRFREQYISSNIEYQVTMKVGRMAMLGVFKQKLYRLSENPDEKLLSVIWEAAQAVLRYTHFILREGFVAIRGLFILYWMLSGYPGVFAVAMIFILFDLAVVLHMDRTMYPLEDEAESRRYEVAGTLSLAVDDESAPYRTKEEQAEIIALYDQQAERYIEAAARRDNVKINYDELGTNALDQFSDAMLYLVLFPAVMMGVMEGDDFFFIIGMIGRAEGPFKVIHHVQDMMMKTRPPLARLGKLCEIPEFDFEPPKARKYASSKLPIAEK